MGQNSLWRNYFEENPAIENQMFFMARILIDAPHQKILVKEIISKVGREVPVAEKFAHILNFDSVFEDKIKAASVGESKHWSYSLGLAHLIDRKVSGVDQSDFRKTLFNLYTLANLASAISSGGSKNFLNYSLALSNYAGNIGLDKSVVDGLVWDKGILREESRDLLFKSFKEALFNVNNYKDYNEVIRAIKEVGEDKPKILLATTEFYEDLVRDFIPELEGVLLEQVVKSPEAKKKSCKI